MQIPTRPVPLGCFVASLGLLFLFVAGLAFSFSRLAFRADPPQAEQGLAMRRYGMILLPPALLFMAAGVLRLGHRMGVKEGERNKLGTSLTD